MRQTTIELQAEAIERWKRANNIEGRDYVPVNNGSRRTASKRALLAEIKENFERKGRKPPFDAKF